ncbi:MAG: hypothetical protein KDA52_21405, partial [Planctomycetaceae bacterium]|nr:hypothetical protein [Planctomycetaceae bacterium]
MRRFETSDGPRYVWAPEVHDALGEECHYYLLRAPDPETHVALTDELNKLLRREDITSHSIYAVFGYYDALIRLWATETVRRRFIRALVASSLKPEALEDLRASSIYYEFAQNKRTITAQEVRENEGPVRRVVEADVADSWDDDPAAVKAFDDLVSIGFIHEVPRTEGIKVYIAFARTRHLLGEHRDSEATGIISAMRTAGFSNVSLYSGSGTLGAHLVKGVSSSSFSSIWQMATAVHEFAATDGLRSMTMPIANMATVVESDTIDNVRIPARFEFDAIREELVRAARLSDEENEHLWAGLNALTKTEKDGLEHVYREAADKLRDTSYFDRVLEAIAGSLLNDADMIESSVAFVTKVEQL